MAARCYCLRLSYGMATLRNAAMDVSMALVWYRQYDDRRERRESASLTDLISVSVNAVRPPAPAQRSTAS